VLDVLLRIGVALAGGALLRMLHVFGVPVFATLPMMAVLGALLSYRMDATRLLVVLCISIGHFIAYLSTRVTPVGVVSENPDMTRLAWNALQLFLPWALPSAGSILALRFETRNDASSKDKKQEEEFTEESLLAVRLPYQTAPGVVDVTALSAASSYEPPTLEEIERLEEIDRRLARLGLASGGASPDSPDAPART